MTAMFAAAMPTFPVLCAVPAAALSPLFASGFMMAAVPAAAAVTLFSGCAAFLSDGAMMSALSAAVTPTVTSTVAAPTASPAAFATRSGTIFGRRPELRGHLCLGHGLAQQLFDATKLVLLFFADKGDGHTVGLGTCGPADAMDIVFAIIGDVVIDHHLDIVDIDTPGKNIGSNEYG